MKRWGRALLAQGVAWLFARWLLIQLSPAGVGSLAEAMLAGLLAAAFSQALREPPWRMPMQAGFSVAVWAGQQAFLPAWAWSVALGLSLLVFGGGLTGRRAPLYLTQARALEAILACLPENAQGRCVDVGAGLGSFILRLAPLRHALQFHGIERAPLVCLLADLRCRVHRAGRVHFGDLWAFDLSQTQVVYAFLSPEAMEGLWRKVCTEMAPGSLLVVNAFPVPGVQAEFSARYGDGSSECVYRYRVPEPGGRLPRD